MLGLAYDYEQAADVRVPPELIPTPGDDLFPGAPNPPAPAQLRLRQAPAVQSAQVARFR